MDEAIALLRAYWADERVDFDGAHYGATAIAMEPKPPQGAHLPIWVGGASAAALRRAGELGDAWMASATRDDALVTTAVSEIRRHAERAGRNPEAIGLQLMLAPPPRDAAGKTFYGDLDRVVRRAEGLRDLGADRISVNATAIFQAGARSVGAMTVQLDALHGRLRAAVGQVRRSRSFKGGDGRVASPAAATARRPSTGGGQGAATRTAPPGGGGDGTAVRGLHAVLAPIPTLGHRR